LTIWFNIVAANVHTAAASASATAPAANGSAAAAGDEPHDNAPNGNDDAPSAHGGTAPSPTAGAHAHCPVGPTADEQWQCQHAARLHEHPLESNPAAQQFGAYGGIPLSGELSSLLQLATNVYFKIDSCHFQKEFNHFVPMNFTKNTLASKASWKLQFGTVWKQFIGFPPLGPVTTGLLSFPLPAGVDS
jgi:hypothetical protein